MVRFHIPYRVGELRKLVNQKVANPAPVVIHFQCKELELHHGQYEVTKDGEDIQLVLMAEEVKQDGQGERT